jgi:hypothetical protein
MKRVQKYMNMKDVAAATEENGDLLALTLLNLRMALGYERLGVRVLGSIASSLEGEGLGYFPEWVLDGEANTAPRAGDVVRVFKKGSPVGKVISAVLEPSNVGDNLLRENLGGDSAATLGKIRELLSTPVVMTGTPQWRRRTERST